MATFFLNCSQNIENYNLCIKHNVAGFPTGGYNIGDLVYLIIRENKIYKLGGRGVLKEVTFEKPWADAEKYKSAFKIDWELCEKTDITKELQRIYAPNFGLAIQGKKDLDIFQGKGSELKQYFNSFFTMKKNKPVIKELTPKELIDHVYGYITSLGFRYSYEEVANFYLALRAKPFVILAGISGTGKTQLPRKFAEAIGFNMEEQIKQVPVRPDWTDGSELLGYTSLNNIFSPKDLTLLIKVANKNPEKPYFFILDEMNLARVEHYFSDYLSVIETRTRNENNEIVTDKILRQELLVGATNSKDFNDIRLPENLYLIGTVNMDETTHSFSRKVLDRANSIEMNEVDLNWIETTDFKVNKLVDITNSLFETIYLTSSEISRHDRDKITSEMGMLIDINIILQEADLHFAYRVRDEIAFYLIINNNFGLISEKDALDFQIVQKILPRIHGSSERIQKVLIKLLYLIEKGEKEKVRTDIEFSEIENQFPINSLKYQKASKKILFMLKRFDDDRFTSFWL